SPPRPESAAGSPPAHPLRAVLPGTLDPGPLETGRDRVTIDRMVLRSLAFDLDRAHQAAEPGAAQPVPAAGQAEQQAAAIGVTAPGRIDRPAHRRRLDRRASAVVVEDRTLATPGDDQRVDLAGDLLVAHAGTLDEHGGLVVVDHHGGGDL